MDVMRADPIVTFFRAGVRDGRRFGPTPNFLGPSVQILLGKERSQRRAKNPT